MAVSTGVDGLDAILDGGLPANRTTLVTGTPGTGKSTLAMRYLQTGLDAGEQCLYVSTEQTVSEIRDAFEPFDFDLDNSNLTMCSLQARPGRGDEDLSEYGISKRFGPDDEDDAPGFLLRTLEGGSEIDQRQVRFTAENIRQYLKDHGDQDRIVVDSLSGLRTLSDDDDRYRRAVLDFIQLFNAELGATALLTAETHGVRSGRGESELLGVEDFVQYTVNGVVRLWRENVRGDYRRFLDVMKMRGVDHDTRKFEFTFDTDGIHLISRRRTHSPDYQAEFLPSGIEGLDDLLGGGFQLGGSVLLEHDGQANIQAFVSAALSNALDEMFSIALMPRVDTPPRYLSSLFDRLGVSMETLLDRDQLFILDALGAWEPRQNVYDLSSEAALQGAVADIYDRARGDGTLLTLNTEAMMQTAGQDSAREFRYWLQAQHLDREDLLLEVHNPNLLTAEDAAFFGDSATQTLETWLTDDGLQYVRLQKAITGEVGSLRVVEYTEESPYVRTVE